MAEWPDQQLASSSTLEMRQSLDRRRQQCLPTNGNRERLNERKYFYRSVFQEKNNNVDKFISRTVFYQTISLFELYILADKYILIICNYVYECMMIDD